MKICVIGAGAIGGLLGVRFAQSGHDVTLVARGANLQAITRDGMKLILADGAEIVARNLETAGSIDALPPQDLVILAVKAHQVAAVAAALPALFHENTILLPMQNGIPWWYFQRLPAWAEHTALGTLENRRVLSVDPDGLIARSIDPERIVGCVVYPAAELAAPGVVRHVEGDRFPIGELDGTESERARALSEAFVAAGLKAPVLADIRSEIWLKLWGNLTFNPISALTHSTLVDICQYAATRQLAADMMAEAQAVAERLGVTFRVSLDRRIAGAEKVGKHKTSMLQDIEQGRDPEIDALVGAVIELGRDVEVPTPHVEAVYALTKLLAQTVREERVFIRAQPVSA